VCFGGEDWWYHHPHSKNHLMRQFARAGNRVVLSYLENRRLSLTLIGNVMV
jgi:hypothetical protein